MLKRKGEIWFVLKSTSRVTVFVVLNVVTSPVPTEILIFGLFMTVNHYFHAHFVKRVLFILVENVEFDLLGFEGVGYFEKEPLRVPIGVDVILQEQIILTL